MPTPPESLLAATLDNVPLPEDEARALWKQFSEHMDQHRGDLAGFAKKHGFTQIAPTYQAGKAVLVAWRSVSPPAVAPGPSKRPKSRSPKPSTKAPHRRRK